MLRRRAVALVLLFAAVALSGCGYHVAGAAAHIPANVRVLAVPTFKTNVLQYRTEVALTEATTRELNTRTRYRVTHSDDPETSDAMLQGTVLTELIAPLTYDPSTGSTSSYLVQITAKVVLTARDAVADKIANFEAGADDYLTKPFAFAELAVRVKALLRRGPVTRANVLRIADLEIDRLTHQVRRNGASIKLTAKE